MCKKLWVSELLSLFPVIRGLIYTRIMGNLDPRFIGIALGMGPTRIFGRVRASLKVDNVQLDCSLLVVEVCLFISAFGHLFSNSLHTQGLRPPPWS